MNENEMNRWCNENNIVDEWGRLYDNYGNAAPLYSQYKKQRYQEYLKKRSQNHMNEEIKAFGIIQSDCVNGIGVRVNSKIAKKWLLENKSVISGGNVFYLYIKNLGMGVYKITKAPLSVRETQMVK